MVEVPEPPGTRPMYCADAEPVAKPKVRSTKKPKRVKQFMKVFLEKTSFSVRRDKIINPKEESNKKTKNNSR